MLHPGTAPSERRVRSLPPVFVAVAFALALAPANADAQYFGRNKVNYERFDFRILRAPNFDVFFYPEAATATADAARMIERWNARFSTFLRHTVPRRAFILFADHADFQQNNVIDIQGEGTGGVTEGFRERVLLPLTGVYADNDHVLGHELVHVFQYDMSKRAPQPATGGEGGGTSTPRGGGLGLNALPLWFVEGMAEYLAIGRDDPNTAMWMREAVRRDDFPTVRKLTTDTRYFPYRYGQALWAYIGGTYGDDAVVQLFRAALASGVEPAIRRVLRTTPDSLSSAWAAATRAAYQPLLEGRTVPENTGTQIIANRPRRGGEYNLSPVVSPDGRRIAFFSSRGLFGIVVYIADAETGRVIRRLGSINTPQHYDALSFINSAGAWSPDGRRLAYVVYSGGDQVIEIHDVERNRSVRTITAPDVGAAVDPAWSPDGRYIAFTGIRGGISDLYLYDLSTGSVEQLTTGRNAEFQPAWSPDGRTLAFMTDRGEGTDFEQLTYRQMRLATIDVASREIRLLSALPRGKAITPQFSVDGSSLYFVSDADGVPDIYRMHLASGTVFRVTRVATGISGISRLSPALSIASQTGRLVFSIFHGQGYDIARLEPAEALGEPVTTVPTASASVLPPAPPQSPSLIEAFLASASVGLPPADAEYAVDEYRPALKLDYIAPPTVGASFGGPFGTQLGGGIAASFSDQLGNHNVIGVLQAQGELADIGGQVIYRNVERRWNYAAVAGRIPYVTGYSFYSAPPTGTPAAAIYNEVRQRVYYDHAGAVAQYPFSPTRRLEFSGMLTRQSARVDIAQYALDNLGRVLAQQRERAPAPDALTYTQGTAALVGDFSFFGLTSPVAGGRYRLEATPTFGSLTFTSTLADYRRYVYTRPVTFAVRGMQYSRYGRDAEDTTRLPSIFVGSPWLVRGYDRGDFRTAECVAPTQQQANVCPVFNRLSGSRIAIFNAEVRVPVLGPYGFALIPTRLIPLEIAPFFDAGLAWGRGESPELRFATGDEARTTIARVPVFSTGLSARVNLLGFAILEAYYAYPFQRPDRGAHFGFQLVPGW